MSCWCVYFGCLSPLLNETLTRGCDTVLSTAVGHRVGCGVGEIGPQACGRAHRSVRELARAPPVSESVLLYPF